MWGLPSVERLPRPGAADRKSGHRVRTKIGGIPIEWDEKPFEWVRPERFEVVREYLSGPIKNLRVLVELMPGSSGGTRLVYEIWLQPRGILGVLVIPLRVRILKRRFGETFGHYDNLASKGGTPADSPMFAATALRPHIAPQGQKRLEAATRSLVEQGLALRLSEKLAKFILTADDMDLTHIRPYALADAWRTPRRDLLNLCLHATRSGVLDLQWDVLCPLCRGAQESNSALRQIHP
jgi:uncharacterized protein DUF5939